MPWREFESNFMQTGSVLWGVVTTAFISESSAELQCNGLVADWQPNGIRAFIRPDTQSESDCASDIRRGLDWWFQTHPRQRVFKLRSLSEEFSPCA